MKTPDEIDRRLREAAVSRGYRPSIFAAPFQKSGEGGAVELLSIAEQDALVAISELMNVRRHTVLYAEGSEARYVYNVIGGVATTYQLQPNGNRHVTAFLFAHDVMGLSVDGRYMATAQALTPLVAYRIPIEALKPVLERDPRLDMHLLCKLCHELRSAQYHANIVAKHDAHERLAGFLLLVECASLQHRFQADELTLPMSRHDMADYLGLSTESVSRALHSLESQGVILRKGPRTITLLDVAKLRAIAGQV